jgi:hypothetical protein
MDQDEDIMKQQDFLGRELDIDCMGFSRCRCFNVSVYGGVVIVFENAK